MCKLGKRLIVFLLVAALTVIPFGTAALAQDKPVDESINSGQMMVDTVVFRPLGFVGTVLGTTMWFISLPFSIPGGNEQDVRKKLINEPARYTFKRQLGDL
ncbi:MAG: hypothetical protein GY859_29090 [Desulfobacterales bacterium]|nr:hypothetical protein [Desulfobacterales bacterium]